MWVRQLISKRFGVSSIGAAAVVQGSTTTIQSQNGKVRADHPPNAGWFGTSTPSQSTNGGTFFTDCC